ncbi:M20 family metallopeptidase [Frigoribacterium sp. PhB24]|uniref:M20 family metallopeptidase n=1 Tax=Frigoribacterium sp. PhB24 TaxID=2485204 RepID=UPI000FA833A3|nr:M20 family metallopeptidase [Frigoribacterium sp. PhB24]ROS51517.1 glutamate carboxypeptidase [Frigoribacterium sp. PhB24]
MNPLVEAAEARRPQLVADLTAYVQLETPSDDRAALAAGLTWVRSYLGEHLGAPDSESTVDGAPHGDVAVLDWDAVHEGTGSVAILCHYDTVWPLGTLADWPVTIDGDRLTGPGAFDMKAGLVQVVHALTIARERGLPLPSVRFVLNGDEEIGSPASRPVIEAAVAGRDAVLVFEASAGGALKTARKGVGLFTVTTRGVEGHAGLDPENGVSAIDEMARVIVALHDSADLAAGTSVNVGTMTGGSRANVTAGSAEALVDVRVTDVDEMRRMDAAFAGLAPHREAAEIAVDGGWNRPVMVRGAGTAALFAVTREVALEQGVVVEETSVGGASDGNFAAALGLPVLDGLGAVGDGAHARHEWISIDGMVERTAVAAGLLTRLGGGA